MKIQLNNRDDVERARSLATWLSRPAVDQVVITIPWLPERQRARLEKRIKYLFNDCGCLWGGPVFLVVFSAVLVTKWSSGGFSWPTLGVSFGIGAMAALTAKFTALACSGVRLKSLLNRIIGLEPK